MQIQLVFLWYRVRPRGILVTAWRPSERGRRRRPRSWSVCGGGHRHSSCCRETYCNRQCRRTVWCAPLLLCNQARTCWYNSVAVTTDAWTGRSNSLSWWSRSTASPEKHRLPYDLTFQRQASALLTTLFLPYFLSTVIPYQPRISSIQFSVCIHFFQVWYLFLYIAILNLRGFAYLGVFLGR
jgi:hypothetical protein